MSINLHPLLRAHPTRDRTFTSSAPSGVIFQLIEEFKFSTEVATLTIALFVAGYCVGPLVWGPLSEQVGRRPVFVGSFFVYTAFQVGCAVAPNTAALLLFRFLGGTFAAAPLANSGYVISRCASVDPSLTFVCFLVLSSLISGMPTRGGKLLRCSLSHLSPALRWGLSSVVS